MSKIDVLDHGYVRFVEAWGHGLDGEAIRDSIAYDSCDRDCEAGIIEAARQSTQGNFRGWDQDQRLLEFLYRNNHATPFEFAGMVIEVQAPIFVFREWHRHRTQSYNEMSARYAPLPDLYYEPTLDRCMMANAATTNKQAQNASGSLLEERNAKAWLDSMVALYEHAEGVYKHGLEIGIPKEVARVVMPVGHYTRMRASASLRNWLAFLTLRMDPAAQWEIRQFANAVGNLVAEHFPRTWKLFEDGRQ